jgi:hypothetical protein
MMHGPLHWPTDAASRTQTQSPFNRYSVPLWSFPALTHAVEADRGAIEALEAMLSIRAFEGKSLELKAARCSPVEPLIKAAYALLFAFVTASRRLLTRGHLISATRMDDHIFDRSVDVVVYRLRPKLQGGRGPPPSSRMNAGRANILAVKLCCIRTKPPTRIVACAFQG